MPRGYCIIGSLSQQGPLSLGQRFTRYINDQFLPRVCQCIPPSLEGEPLEDMGVQELPVLLPAWGRAPVLPALFPDWEDLTLPGWGKVPPAWERAPALPAFLPGWVLVLFAWGRVPPLLPDWERLALPTWGDLAITA